ncbi:MAG: hypothetical protein ACRC10_10025 [Thermoguttaceae bacterium]
MNNLFQTTRDAGIHVDAIRIPSSRLLFERIDSLKSFIEQKFEVNDQSIPLYAV